MSKERTEEGFEQNTQQLNLEPKKYPNRSELESDIMFDLGLDVQIEGRWKGESTVRIPRWNAELAEELELALFQTIEALFPNDIFVLATINPSNLHSMATQLMTVTAKIRPQIKDIVTQTLRISSDEYGPFFRSVTPYDILLIWGTIVYQEVSNPRMQALLKKAVALLVEKFQLQDVWQQFQESMVGHQTGYYEIVPENNSLSGTPTQPSTSSAN